MKKVTTLIIAAVALGSLVASAQKKNERSKYKTSSVKRVEVTGVGDEDGVMRRDPSDVIKVGDLYYVWYSKGTIFPGYDATVWYATSKDGINWEEKGESVARGEKGTWEGASVFTPNILVANGKYYLFYTGTSKSYHEKPFKPDSKIGVAVSDSPDGPWVKNAEGNPVITNSKDPKEFDSYLIDDACLITRDGKYWLYYKGRQKGKSPAQTKMGVAIAEKPEGPYVKHEGNPVIPGNHEVVVWPQGTGVAAMIGTVGPKSITKSILYSEDGLSFKKVQNMEGHPWAAGTYRPEAFTDSGKGEAPVWGIEMALDDKKNKLPRLRRYEFKWAE